MRLTLAEYSAVRVNPTHFLTAPGHEAEEEKVGVVVVREGAYVVVEKDQAALER